MIIYLRLPPQLFIISQSVSIPMIRTPYITAPCFPSLRILLIVLTSKYGAPTSSINTHFVVGRPQLQLRLAWILTVREFVRTE